ncbi:MAG: FHA domain-containing protein [Chloroflexi bacterium]|nr:FHA domain-containing protein [Chloroflexota bacterium]
MIFVLRLAFLGLLYLFLLQVVLALRRDLKQTSQMPAAAPNLGRLVVVESEQPDLRVGAMLDLQPSTTIGRAPHNSIILNDSFVSASHAVVTLQDKRWWIEDIGSTNGTLVNRKEIREPTPVDFGDIVEIGRVKLKLVH